MSCLSFFGAWLTADEEGIRTERERERERGTLTGRTGPLVGALDCPGLGWAGLPSQKHPSIGPSLPAPPFRDVWVVCGRKRARACGTDQWIGKRYDEDSLGYKMGNPEAHIDTQCYWYCLMQLFFTNKTPELKTTCRAKIRRVKANLH